MKVMIDAVRRYDGYIVQKYDPTASSAPVVTPTSSWSAAATCSAFQSTLTMAALTLLGRKIAKNLPVIS